MRKLKLPLSPGAQALILSACRKTGSFDPEIVLAGIRNDLTREEAEAAGGFLAWVSMDTARRAFGAGSLETRLREFTQRPSA